MPVPRAGELQPEAMPGSAGRRAPGIEAEQYDASETSLAAIVDDARAMSLFASERLIFVIGAETAMPRIRGTSDDDDDEAGSGAGGLAAGVLEAYVKNPTPGVTLVFEATRWDLEGEDKTKDRTRAQILRRDSRRGGVPPLQRRRGARGTGSHRARGQPEAGSGGRRSPGGSACGGRGAHRGRGRKALALRQTDHGGRSRRCWSPTPGRARSSRW